MELGSILALIAIALIIFVMFQIHTLFTRKSEPDIIINNYIQSAEKSDVEKYIFKDHSGTDSEIKIDTITTVKDIGGEVKLSNETIGESNITKTAEKIKVLRTKNE